MRRKGFGHFSLKALYLLYYIINYNRPVACGLSGEWGYGVDPKKVRNLRTSEDYERKATMLCPTCGGTQFEYAKPKCKMMNAYSSASEKGGAAEDSKF
jgi:hypothetical protein